MGLGACVSGEGDLLGDLDPKTLQTDDAARMIGQEANGRESEIRKNLSADTGLMLHGVASVGSHQVGGDSAVREDFVFAFDLQGFCSAAALMQIQEDAAGGCPDFLKGCGD